MTIYLVSYDLDQGDGTHDYADLYAAFAELDCVRILDSAWLVATDGDLLELTTHLRGFLDPSDHIWLSRVTGDCYGHILDEGIRWLAKHHQERF